MTTCASCGAEVEEGDACPRCGEPVSKERTARSLALSSAILGAVFCAGAAVQMIVDLAADGRIGWSLVALASAAEAWILAGFPMLAYRRPAIVLAVMGGSSLAYLKVLEVLVGGSWFLPLALPIAASAFASAALAVFLCVKARRRGPNVAAFILLGGTLACVAVENVLSLRFSGRPSCTWSGIAAAAALPTALLLLGIQKRLRQAGR